MPATGDILEDSIIERILSIPLLLAPSISITSRGVPSAICVHEEQTPQGLSVGPFSQFKALAIILASDVLPTPCAPENKYACAILFCIILLDIVCVI